MIHINLSMLKSSIQEVIASWIQPYLHEDAQIYLHSPPQHENEIIFFHIQRIFDWVHLNRYQRKNPGIYFVIIQESLMQTSPLITKLQIECFTFYPLKKYSFYRSVKYLLDFLKNNNVENKSTYYESKKNMYLRKLIESKCNTNEELDMIFSLFDDQSLPNVVCFLQGFIHLDSLPHINYQAFSLIRTIIKRNLSILSPVIYFIPYERYLLLLFKVPQKFNSVRHFEGMNHALENAILSLLQEYRIQMYIGVGTIYDELTLLHQSLKEAKLARKHPPFDKIYLRFYEDVPKDPAITKYTEFMEANINQPLSAKEVARHIHLSYTYFSRNFKKETGKSFSEYMTFLRLRQAVWLLRHTDETIEEIADKIGFNTSNYFSCVFKKYIGITPSEYRLATEIHFQ